MKVTMISVITLFSTLSVALGASWCDSQLVRRSDAKDVYRVGVLAIRGKLKSSDAISKIHELYVRFATH